MAQDQQSYRRAAGAALAGLIVQIILAGLMWLTAIAAQSPPLYAAMLHVLGGLPVWIVLLLLYHQHRLERAEALETEQLARADANTAALFEEHADDLEIARRRLNSLYKWGLGIVSVVVAIYLLSVGGYLFYSHYHALGRGTITANAYRGDVTPIFPTVACIAIAFIAFIAARYEAGMTKIAEWQLLRGGASYLIGNALVALLCAVGLFSYIWGDRTILSVMTLVVPAVMVLLGLEILFNFLLGAYRPRRAGEVPRPAFDSRVLGLLTSPKSLAKALSDAINYQFGFEVSSSWFYQLLGRAITPLVAFAIVVLILVSSIVVVQPHQQAIVTQFGRIVGDPLGPGLHFKLPWPFQSARPYTTGRVHQLSIGSASKGLTPGVAILWTKAHSEGKEDYLVTAPTPFTTEDGGEAMAGNDGRTPGVALIGLQMILQYRVGEGKLLEYVRSVDDPQAMLTRIAERRLNQFLVTKDTDTIIGFGRIGAGEMLRRQIQEDADNAKLGLEVVFAGFTGVHPPSDSDVAAAFHQQIGALQDREKAVEEAQKDAIGVMAQVAGSREQALAITKAIEEVLAAQRRLDEARAANPGQNERLAALEKEIAEKSVAVDNLLTSGGRAAELIYEARAYRWDRTIAERSRAELFAAELSAYRQAPDIYKARRYYEVLSQGASGSRKYIVGAGTVQGEGPTVRLDLSDTGTGLESIIQPK